MFGGTGDAAPHDLMKVKKTFFNRDWNSDESQSGLQIGGIADKDQVLNHKRFSQAAVKAALDADKVVKEMTRRLEKKKENGGVCGGVELELDWKGRPSAQQQQPVSSPIIPSKYSVASMIAQESSPEKSPRYRNSQELQGEDEEVGKVESFGIGESADAIKRRKKAQREQYLQALDRDTGFTRETVARAPRAPREYEAVSSGVTGFQIGGSSVPTLDMSPSMKNLTLESKRRSQESYRLQLAQQSTVRRSKKEMLSERVSAAMEPTMPLPFMR